MVFISLLAFCRSIYGTSSSTCKLINYAVHKLAADSSEYVCCVHSYLSIWSQWKCGFISCTLRFVNWRVGVALRLVFSFRYVFRCHLVYGYWFFSLKLVLFHGSKDWIILICFSTRLYSALPSLPWSPLFACLLLIVSLFWIDVELYFALDK